MLCTRLCTTRVAESVDRPTIRVEGSQMGRWVKTWWIDGWVHGWVYNLFTTVDTINREVY
jgi:hypothetical protein